MFKGRGEDRSAVIEVSDSFEERNDREIGDSGLFAKELDLKEIAQAVGHTNDIAGDSG
jgi:hypothetical protein